MNNRRIKRVFMAAVILLFAVLTVQARPLATITVEAGEHTRIDTPVSVGLECINSTQLHLEEIKGSRRVPVPTQLEELVTALPIEMPELPMWAPATPGPAEASLSGRPMVYAVSQGAER